jgi:gas vesicle protein
MGQSPAELRREIEQTRADLGETLEAIGERVSPGRIVHRRTERVKRGFVSVKEAVMGSATDAYESAGRGVEGAASRAQSAAQSTAHEARDLAGTAADQVREAPQVIRRQTRGNPIAAGLVAFGGGLLVAAAFPPTEPEQRWSTAITDRLEPLKEQAQEAAQEVKEGVTEAASGAAQEVKGQTMQAAEAVKDQARQAADQVQSEAQTAADTVKDQARG